MSVFLKKKKFVFLVFSVFRFLRILLYWVKEGYDCIVYVSATCFDTVCITSLAICVSNSIGCFSMGYSGGSTYQRVGAASVAAQASAMHASIHAAKATGPYSPLLAANSTMTKSNRNFEFIFSTVTFNSWFTCL